MHTTRRFWCSPTAIAVILLLTGVGYAGEDNGQLASLRQLLDGGEWAASEQQAWALLPEIESSEGTHSLRVAEVLDLLVESRCLQSKVFDAESRPLAERAVQLKVQHRGQESYGAGVSLLNLGSLVELTEGPRIARRYFERALLIFEKEHGPEDPLVARALLSLGFAKSYDGDFLEAKRLYERAREIQQQSLGPRHPEVARTLLRMGRLDFIMGDYASAGTFYEEALHIAEESYGMSHPFVAEILASQGYLHVTMGRQEPARTVLERAHRIAESAYGSDHPLVADVLDSLGFLKSRSGEIGQAREFLERSIAIRETVQGPNHVSLVRTLNLYQGLLQTIDNRPAAVSANERLIRIAESHLNADHPGLGFLLSAYGNLLVDVGDYTAARSTLERAVRIARNSIVSNEALLMHAQGNLAYLLARLGNSAEALPLFERVLPLAEKVFGPEHFWMLEGIAVHGALLMQEGRLSEALTRLEKALELREKLLGPEHIKVANSLTALAALLRRTGELDRSRQLYERAIAIYEAALGPDTVLAGNSVLGLAWVLAMTGEFEASFETALRAERLGRASLRLTAGGLPERQALGFASVRVSGLHLALSLLGKKDRVLPGGTRRAWTSLIRSRALVLDEMAARNLAAGASPDPAVVRLMGELAAARAEMARLVVAGPGRSPMAKFRDRVASARREKERVERSLAGACEAFHQRQTREKVGLMEVAAALPSDSVLVAYASYTRRPLLPSLTASSKQETEDPNGAAEAVTGDRVERAKAFAIGDPLPSYVAFVLPTKGEDPVFVSLGSRAEIDALVADWRLAAASAPRGLLGATTMGERACMEAGRRLRVAIWDPLAPYIADAHRVFIVPDGSIHLVNLSALPDHKDGYLLETGPLMHYLSAERELVRQARRLSSSRSMLAFGGPDYDVFPSSPTPHPETTGVLHEDGAGGPAKIPGAELTYDGAPPSCDRLLDQPFPALPSARIEAEEVSALWRGGHTGSASADVLTLTGDEADESSFKRLASDYSVIHLATHAYFAQDRCPSVVGPESGIKNRGLLELSPVFAGDNPLLLSGLAFAGANRQRDVPSRTDDGILTAEEISSLDLAGVEWVVLSGCETGLGRMETWEGVVGLRRAFRTAGAGTLIMSLWRVEDEAARDWMRSLYEARLSGLSTSEAIRYTGLAVLRNRREANLSTHPFFWGAFVASGDWQ